MHLSSIFHVLGYLQLFFAVAMLFPLPFALPSKQASPRCNDSFLGLPFPHMELSSRDLGFSICSRSIGMVC